MPGFVGSVGGGVPSAFVTAVPQFYERNYTISGLTIDINGAPVAGVTIKLFNTATDTLVQQTVSSSTGAYSFIADKTQSYYTVEYKVGPPDIYGSSANTLVPV